MKIKDVLYLPSGRIFILQLDDGYIIESTEMRDVAVDGKLHIEVRESSNPQVIWKHLVPYEDKWLMTVSTQRGCPHNCKFCFLPETQIYTKTGTKNIENIHKKDYVLGYSIDKRILQDQKVTDVFSRYYNGKIINIETNDGKTLKVTPEHPIYTTRGWVLAQDLLETDELLECQ